VNNDDIYSGYDWGIQSLEASSDKHLESEKQGLCLMWAILMGDLALSFPEYSVSQIVKVMMKKARSKQTKLDNINDYLLFVIRGYIVSLTKKLDISFENETSIHSACERLAMESAQIVKKEI
jgi:hypothetical protein